PRPGRPRAPRPAGRPRRPRRPPPPADLAAKPRRALEDFGRLIAGLYERRAALPVPAFIDEVAAASGYRDALRAERTAEADARLENLEELVAAAEEFLATQAALGAEGVRLE